MDLSRRSFFGSMIAAGVVAATDPEELLWTPGKKKIFIPPVLRGPTRQVQSFYAQRLNFEFDRMQAKWEPAELAERISEFEAAVKTLRPPQGRVWGTWSKA